MAQRGQSRRLSAQDASFLYFEKREAPLHIGSIAVFEGKVDYDRFVENVESKIHLIPLYQQLAVPAPFNISHPTWEWDPNFDIRRHIKRATCPSPGDDRTLFDFAAELFAPMLERDKPLWEMYVVEGLEGDRTALVSKVHHALVDGVSGIELFMLVMDVSPTPIPPAPAPQIEKTPASPPLMRFLDGLLDNSLTMMNAAMDRQRSVVDNIYGQGPARDALRALEATLPYLQVPVVRAPFNKPLHSGRKCAFSEYSFAEIRQIRQQAGGGTINDVVLTVLGGGMAKYLEMHGQTTHGRTIRVLTPVNVRKDDEKQSLGNRVSMLLIEVPVGVTDPIERLEIVRKRTEALKRRHVADGIEGMGSSGYIAPAALQAALGTLPTPPNTLANMVCTNVPGPMIPLYTVGHRLQAHYPLIPLGWEMGISLGVTSYDQKLFFGFMADAVNGSDVQRLKEFTDQAYVELRNAAGIGKSDLPQLGVSATPQKTTANGSETPKRKRASAPSTQAISAESA
jgi:diacylglycerol O-acyltransferase / wax synthase